MKHASVAIWLLTAVLSAPLWLDGTVHAADCVVDNTSDSDATQPTIAGSLRDCLSRVGPGDTVVFHDFIYQATNSVADTTINVLSELPPLDDGNVTIDASDRRVTINGSGAGSSSGLVITSSNNTIRGVTIVGFPGSGVQLSSGNGNVIGGSRNTGTGPNGQGLRIANCGSFGIEITGVGTSSNVVKGCWIGLDAGGSGAQPNLAGVAIDAGSSSNTIGSVVPDEANVISGNAFEGVTVSGTGTDDNVIIGNVIGASSAGTVAGRSGSREAIGSRSSVGNGSAGVFLSKGTQGSKVGGTNTGEGNAIAFNGGSGIELRDSGSKHNSARGNSIGRNSRGGIKLFDGSNDGIKPPVITAVQAAPPDGTGVAKFRVTGTTTQAGSVEIFNDSGDQGETLLGRGTVAGGAFTVDVEAVLVTNLTATLTDALGNTSEFGVFGLTTGDTDEDGVADALEGLAGTDPGNALDTPAKAPVLNIKQMSIKLNFAKSNQDSITITPTVNLPPGLTFDGLNIGIYVAGHSGQLVLDAKGKAKSADGLVAIALKTSSKTGTTTVKYTVKKSALQADLAAATGVADRTTIKGGELMALPIAVTTVSSTGRSVYFGAVTVTYKATQGKSGKAAKAK